MNTTELKQLSDHDLIEHYRTSKARERDLAFAEIWRRHGDFARRDILKTAHKMGGVSDLWADKNMVQPYFTVGQECLVEGYFNDSAGGRVEPSESHVRLQEGSIQLEILSEGHLAFLRAIDTHDPAKGACFRTWVHVLNRNAAKDVKRKLSAGLVGKSAAAEPQSEPDEPNESQLDAQQIADKILTARSEAYVLRWCKRSDVDAIDLDIVYHNLLRPRGRNGRRSAFMSLGEIADKHGLSRQSIAKRRKNIEYDLIAKGSKRGSDGATPCRKKTSYGSWLSDSSSLRICSRGGRRADRQQLVHRAARKLSRRRDWRYRQHACDYATQLHEYKISLRSKHWPLMASLLPGPRLIESPPLQPLSDCVAEQATCANFVNLEPMEVSNG